MAGKRKPTVPPLIRPGSAESALDEVLQVLQRLLEQAQDVEAEVGVMPGADEALGWAIGEVEAIQSRLRAN